ncbi:MAG: lysophospholipid acyltransferase family protein [Gemmatimonadaceae bacterium]|nr:lysophospholipid acyltransferase family protein [Gemmatimonadaceae bacterium]
MTGWRLRLAVLAGRLFLRVLSWTWRLRFHDRAHYDDARAAGGFVLALWHGEFLVPLVVHGKDPLHAIISQSNDGELITQIGQGFGIRGIRGSSSRGGAAALAAMVQGLREGHAVAVTVDGPRGPRFSVAPGAALASRRASVPIIPIRIAVPRAWRMRSWDRFLIPKPFAAIDVSYGPPLRVTDAHPDGIDGANADVASALRTAGARIGADA